MPDNIDLTCTIPLPDSAHHVFVQLEETRPERVEYRINLRDPDNNVIHVVPQNFYDIPVPHDLGRSTNALRGYKMICVGEVKFAVSGPWQLRCELRVNDSLVSTCGPGALNGIQGTVKMFRFTCIFV
ncbi:MAG TPA: hypothetical protein VNP98_01775 [Chthoniobacterales bacterium]|nr:hypothetical protein [Chthoniobacterales bacterium]